jgi:aminocarboxymuconate-semialdehyde decarboxylase
MVMMSAAGRLAALGPGLIDVHTHAVDPDLGDFAARYGDEYPCVARTSAREAHLILRGSRYRTLDSRCWSVEARIRDMDAEGVAAQVVSPIPATLCHSGSAEGAKALTIAQNDFMASLVEAAPDRFLALGCVPLQAPELAIDELERCVVQLGFVGVEIGTRVGDLELADPRFVPFFAAAAELGAVIFVHPVDQSLEPRWSRLGVEFGLGMPSETGAAAAGLLMSDLFDQVPELTLCLAHAGGTLPSSLPRIALGQALVHGERDKSRLASARARLLWCDSLSYDVDSLQLAALRFTPDHVVLGTDYPFTAREVPPGAVLAGAAGLERVHRRNALDLLSRVAPRLAAPAS